jgi:hypothetical protein
MIPAEQLSVAQMVKELGVAIAEAQYQMDQAAIRIALLLGDGEIDIAGDKHNLMELGFTPTFYQLTEATVEAKVSLTATRSEEFGGEVKLTGGYAFFAASVSASYSQKYSYTATGSSSITAKFVSVPPPALLTDAIRAHIKRPPK